MCDIPKKGWEDSTCLPRADINIPQTPAGHTALTELSCVYTQIGTEKKIFEEMTKIVSEKYPQLESSTKPN